VLADPVGGTISNLFAPQTGGQGQGPISGEFTKFDFETQSETDSDTEWDIAFRATTIIVNGGESQGTTDEPARTGDAAAYIVSDALFSEVTTVDPSLFAQDAVAGLAIPAGSDNGWYNYNFMTNVVSPLAGKVLVFRTTEGKYAKVEILSYYENAPANPVGTGADADTPRYYTFNYTYQPNDNVTTFE
ncbi:MAG: HmuY family protein, partial [Bacteroidota bacterium]